MMCLACWKANQRKGRHRRHGCAIHVGPTLCDCGCFQAARLAGAVLDDALDRALTVLSQTFISDEAVARGAGLPAPAGAGIYSDHFGADSWSGGNTDTGHARPHP